MIRRFPHFRAPERTDVYLASDGVYVPGFGKPAVGVSHLICLGEAVTPDLAEQHTARFREMVARMQKRQPEPRTGRSERPFVPGHLVALALAHPGQ